VPEAAVMAQKISFYKNFAIVGGLLAFAAFGPGAYSLDARRRG
jgi:putative oxidoreductase